MKRPRLVLTAVALVAVVAACVWATWRYGGGSRPHIPACHCGGMPAGHCACKNCCERTTDPTWTPEQSKP